MERGDHQMSSNGTPSQQQILSGRSRCWNDMHRSSPKILWRKFRSYTNTQQESCTCHPDLQWQHWAGQGDVTENVWTTRLIIPAARWSNWLRGTSLHIACEPLLSQTETEECRKDAKSGKAAGPDGVPSDVVKNLPALSLIMHLVFNLMLFYGV